MINVSMLGCMSVTVERKRVPLTFGPRGRLLAGYLFEFPGRVHRREQLSDMFWEDSSPSHARAAMNTALWRLRKVLSLDPQHGDDCLHSTAEEIVFEPDASLHIDTHVFDSDVNLALPRHSPRDATASIALLERAVAGYSGSFLDGDVGDWIIAERERLHSLYVRCQCELMRLHALNLDYEAAIAAGRRVLAADPFRETVMRTVALLLFLNGQRAQAIEDLARWQTALRAQVGVSALPETRQLQAALVSGDICGNLAHWRQTHLVAAPSAR